tara:strand:- start:82 stop:1212 length:1131 start_codon:yes stop_codon:yes gene_type:complete
MRVLPFSYLEQVQAGGLFPDQSLATWTTTEADEWLAYGLANLNTSTFGYDTTTSRIGGSYGSGVAKWAGGSLTSNGKIYAAPHVRNKWAILDTTTDTITESVASVNGSSMGSVYDKITNQVISFGSGGTKIDVATDVASNISGPPNRTANPIQSFNGDELYGSSAFSYTGLRKYTISTNTTSTITPTGASAGRYGEFGTLGRDGCIYYGNGPSSAGFFKYDPATNIATIISNPGGVFTTLIQHYDGYIYFLPNNATTVIRKFDPSTGTFVGSYDWGTTFQSSNACIGLDGRIYVVSSQSNKTVIRWFDPIAVSHGDISLATGDKSYQGITVGANGDLYLIPWTSPYFNKVALITGTGTTATDIVSQYNFGGRLCWG